MNADTAPRYAGHKMIIRRMRNRLAKPLSREDELAEIEAFIARHGVRRVTIDTKGVVRLRTVLRRPS